MTVHRGGAKKFVGLAKVVGEWAFAWRNVVMRDYV